MHTFTTTLRFLTNDSGIQVQKFECEAKSKDTAQNRSLQKLHNSVSDLVKVLDIQTRASERGTFNRQHFRNK